MAKKAKNIQANKIVSKKLNLFYMTPTVVTVKDITELLKVHTELTVDLWEAMSVAELTLTEGSIDFEQIQLNFKDPSDRSFIKNREIQTIFYVNLNEEILETVLPYFEEIVQNYQGFFCTDSVDFQPVYVGNSSLRKDKHHE